MATEEKYKTPEEAIDAMLKALGYTRESPDDDWIEPDDIDKKRALEINVHPGQFVDQLCAELKSRGFTAVPPGVAFRGPPNVC